MAVSERDILWIGPGPASSVVPWRWNHRNLKAIGIPAAGDHLWFQDRDTGEVYTERYFGESRVREYRRQVLDALQSGSRRYVRIDDPRVGVWIEFGELEVTG
ncbi:MAG TPA: hypothetical protein VEI97_09830 [bacterium]|nr:hypothetical protein [bacterium]